MRAPRRTRSRTRPGTPSGPEQPGPAPGLKRLRLGRLAHLAHLASLVYHAASAAHTRPEPAPGSGFNRSVPKP